MGAETRLLAPPHQLCSQSLQAGEGVCPLGLTQLPLGTPGPAWGSASQPILQLRGQEATVTS